MSDGNGIAIQAVSYAYGRKTALDGVSMEVNRGSFTALLGPNGAGKSTLMALLTGLFVPDTGSIEILGHDLGHDPARALAQIGIVFQQQTLDLDLSVRQNMIYFAALHGLGARAVGERIESCLARMGLGERHAEKVRALNSGHRRRLEIARSLLHRPRVLLLDEPTVGLDVPSRAEIVEHVHALCREEELTVLWATHLVDEVWADDRLVVLHEGRVRAMGSVDEVLSTTRTANVLSAFNHLTAGSNRVGTSTEPRAS